MYEWGEGAEVSTGRGLWPSIKIRMGSKRRFISQEGAVGKPLPQHRLAVSELNGPSSV